MIRAGVIGYGYWGPNMVRNLAEVDGFQLVAVSDLREERLALAQNRYPAINTHADYRELLDDPHLDAVAIATPVSTHFEIAWQALCAGKHVLVEKPLAMTSEQARRLIDEAERRQRSLMVDHTFVYTGAVRKIRELIGRNELGQIFYYDSTRVNLGLFQHDVNVLWDLAVHDLSIMDYVLPRKPVAVSATGMRHVPGQPENIAYLTCFFDDSLIAHVHVNWLAPVKVRRTLIGGSRKMIVYNDLEPSEKIKVYDCGVTVNNSPESVYQMLISYRTGDMWSPQLDITEGLRTEAQQFQRSIDTGERPITDGEAGLRVIQILEAATLSMQQRGQLVEIERVEKR
jgi:predicted dehydrogenase